LQANSKNTENTPLVSVIIPAYNAERFIAKTLESVICQTYSNWEALVLDDGSRDDTIGIVNRFVEQDSRIRLYQNPQNMGVAATRNRGIELSSGEFVAFLDSDDVWHADKLEKQLQRAETAQADIVYCSYALVQEKDGSRRDYIVPEETDYEKMLYENVLGCSTVMLKRKLVEQQKFDVNFYHEDYALWLKLLRNGAKAAGISQVLVDYTVIENSRSFNKWNAAKKRWQVWKAQERISVRKRLILLSRYAFRGVVKHWGE